MRIYAAYTNEEYYITQIGFSIIKKIDINLKFILAIINSTLMNFYHKNKYLDQSKDLFQKILIQNARNFPIPLSQENKGLKPLVPLMPSLHDQLVSLVDQMLETQIEYHAMRTDDLNRRFIKQKIEMIDNQIDRLVYELYGLTEDEIRIVEGEK